MSIKEELDRKIELADKIVKRLDSGENLSSVLSQVRLLMNLTGNQIMVAQVDILIHGLTNIPYQPIPFSNPTYIEAGIIHMKIWGLEDFSKISINEILKNPWPDQIPKKTLVLAKSVYEIENLDAPVDFTEQDSEYTLNSKLQHKRIYERSKSILLSLRSYIYDHVSNIWIESVREKDRIDLLGLDYRLVIDKLDALETPVGSELKAAIDNLSSDNAANWNACALVCRNVILKLAKILWKIDKNQYVTESGITLEVTKEKEKNILHAYIDIHRRKTLDYRKDLLNKADSLVVEIYEKGSKGKQQIRHDEAQKLVTDTFQLIDILNQTTELVPVDKMPRIELVPCNI